MFSFPTLILLLACVASAAVIPHTPATPPADDPTSNVIKILQSDPSVTTVPDLSIQLVKPTSTDVRGTSPHLTDLSTDIVEPSFSIAASTADMATADKFLFSVSLAAFLIAKKAKNPSSLDWGDDGCSKSPDYPAGFNFLHSCMRHDFGYSNFKTQGRFTESNRKRLDDNFLADLNRECDKQGFFQKVACKTTAVVYHTAVRSFGNL